MLEEQTKLLAHGVSIHQGCAATLRRPAVFLDRDGTLNRDVGYLAASEGWQFTHDAPAALRELRAAGFLILVVTNQSGLARGLFSERALASLHEHVQELLRREGTAVDRFYVSPYHPDHGRERYGHLAHTRKPELGLFAQALADYPIDVAASWMVGDKMSDMEFGLRAGLRSIFIGREASDARIVAAVETLAEAAQIILHGGAARDPNHAR